MDYVEHDMDELFQKAAEQYPLKDSGSNWDAIAPQLAENPVTKQKESKPTGNRKKYLLVLFLLLGFGIAGSLIILKPGTSGDSAAKNVAETKNKKEKISANQYNNDNVFTETETGSEKNTVLTTPLETTKKATVEFHKDRFDQTTKVKLIPDKIFDNALTNPTAVNLKLKKPVLFRENEIFPRNSPPVTEVQFSVPRKNTGRGFYWGILAGPQYNQVKGQGKSKTGFDFGIPLGFRINRSISFETGLYFSRKYYYSEGKYFSMTKPDLSMPGNMVIMELEGKSNVFELPIKLKVDLISKARGRVFSTAGISSYVLTQENNNYHAMVNGSPENMKRTYNNVSHYTAAAFNFSTGFEYRFSNQRSIRAEPYLQLPLKGIGIGAMPVSSAGIHIGLTIGKGNQ